MALRQNFGKLVRSSRRTVEPVRPAVAILPTITDPGSAHPPIMPTLLRLVLTSFLALPFAAPQLTAQTRFGRGCGPVATWPRLELTVGQPRLGARFTITGSLLQPTSRSITAIGGSRTSWGGVPLPLMIDPTVFPPCQLLVAAEVRVAGTTSANGRQPLTFTVPNLRALIGLSIYFQMATLSTQTSLTEGLEIKILR